MSPSQNGQNIENMESIKKYATQIYASHKRAVTTNDYEAIIPLLYPQTDSVSAFGGESLNPPQYGRVFVSIKPTSGPYLSTQIKDSLKRKIKEYSVSGIDIEITDLKFLYIELDVTAYYNTGLARSSSSVNTAIASNLEKYSQSAEINKFGARFKYSKALCVIDNSSDAITSNITKVVIRRDVRVALNSFAEYEICFGNCIFAQNCDGYNLKSSGFNVEGVSGVVYLTDHPEEGRSTGTIDLIRLTSKTQAKVIKKSIGTIDYEKGEIKLTPINITNTVVNKGFPVIEISASPCSNDVLGKDDLYLQLDMENTTIESIPEGSINGTNGTGTSSSYANGSIVRGKKIIPGSTSCDTEDTVTTSSTTIY